MQLWAEAGWWQCSACWVWQAVVWVGLVVSVSQSVCLVEWLWQGQSALNWAVNQSRQPYLWAGSQSGQPWCGQLVRVAVAGLSGRLWCHESSEQPRCGQPTQSGVV